MTSTRQYQHRNKMFDILNVLYNSKYGHLLGFKGGTALYFFYLLPRFSVDCDFDLTQELSIPELKSLKGELLIYLQDHLSDMTIKASGTSDYSIRYVAQYGGNKTIKIEITSKMYDNKYELKILQGLTIQVMKAEWMFAHKLCALVSRYQQRDVIANRDLFDIHYFLSQGIVPYLPIITQRYSKMLDKIITAKQAIAYIIFFIKEHQAVIQKRILDGLGELVDEDQKKRVTKNLLIEVVEKLESYREVL